MKPFTLPLQLASLPLLAMGQALWHSLVAHGRCPGRCWEENPAEPLGLVHPLTQPLPSWDWFYYRLVYPHFLPILSFPCSFPFGNSPLKTRISRTASRLNFTFLLFPPDGCLIHIPRQGQSEAMASVIKSGQVVGGLWKIGVF